MNNQIKTDLKERIAELNKQVSSIEKSENLNLKLQQDLINLEREYNELKKNDKLLRKEYMQRYKEIEQQNLKKIMQKNKQIKE